MSASGARTLAALALHAAALALLSLALLGSSWLDPRSRPRVLLLVDRSHSMPRALSDTAVADVVQAAQAAGAADPQWLDFAGRPAAPTADVPETAADLEPAATNIEAALDAALAAHAVSPYAGVVVVSDGHSTVGDTARALRSAREARLPVQWLAVGRPPPATRVAEVLAPARARVDQRIQVSVQLAGQVDQPLRVTATARSPITGQTQTVSRESTGTDRVTIELDSAGPGALLVDVALEDPASGRTLDAWPDAAVIDVAPRAAILYAQGSAGPLARSLLQGGWALEVIAAARLDAQADALDAYQAVVLDDVAISDAGPRFWAALVAAVQHRGLGLLVLGGERSFARGGYRGSVLESVLPVSSEPPAMDQPASVVFAVDKSGSMGQGSGGVDRFQLAQRAVLETARGLGERDTLGLVVFDAAARVLMPVGPAPAGTLALERAWPATPSGGTRLAPALDAAIGELERSGAARRMLVLVTDGFVDDAPLAGLATRLERARIETVWLAVGPDADVGALERAVGPETGLVLRVDQAAELPVVMRSGLDRRRARVERGNIAAQQRQALPFAPGTWTDWPAVAAHFATRPRPEAVVAVQSERGDPLIAYQRAGQGRVLAVTSGLGRWTPQWLQWREWPRLAGGLAEWVSATPAGGAAALSVRDLPAGLQVEAELGADAALGMGRPTVQDVSIAVDTPTTQGRILAAEPVAPGRWRATVADDGPGLYSFVLSTPLGTHRQLHLRRQRSESALWGTNPALDTWRSAGLIGPWDPDSLVRPHAAGGARPPVDRSLLALGLALFLSGVLVDRTRLTSAGVRQFMRRWRTRA